MPNHDHQWRYSNSHDTFWCTVRGCQATQCPDTGQDRTDEHGQSMSEPRIASMFDPVE